MSAGDDNKLASIGKHYGDQQNFDVSRVNPREVDALLAQELKQLSVTERQWIMGEVHGVHGGGNFRRRRQSNLSEEEIKSRLSLGHMQVELKNIPEKTAYEEAIAMKSPMLSDIAFQTKFLYAENFDPFKAAERMVKYLQLAKELFGVRALHRAVQWKDLSPNALEIIKRGELQTPPFRDQAHRRICVLLKDHGTSHPTRDRVRTNSFPWHSCVFVSG
jgi:hypothetical protein